MEEKERKQYIEKTYREIKDLANQEANTFYNQMIIEPSHLFVSMKYFRVLDEYTRTRSEKTLYLFGMQVLLCSQMEDDFLTVGVIL